MHPHGFDGTEQRQPAASELDEPVDQAALRSRRRDVQAHRDAAGVGAGCQPRTRIAMVMVCDDRVYVDCNLAATLLFECSRGQLVGRRIDDFTPLESRDQVPAAWEAFREAGAAEGVYEILTAKSRRVAVAYSATANFLPGLHLSVLISENAGGELQDAGIERPRKRLSPREREILERVALGVNGREISRELFISPETVRTHLCNVLTKLGARTRAHAIAIALQTGEISADALDSARL